MERLEKDIIALCDSYGDARKEIEDLEDEVERQIGLGTLRLEASQTLTRLRNARPPLPSNQIKPLEDYVGTSRGGRVAEWSVKAVEKGASKASKEVFSSLRETILTGSAAGVFAVLLAVGIFVVDSGQAFMTSLVLLGGGALWYFARGVEAAVSNGHRVLFESWDWACGLGSATERALTTPRQHERRLWSRVSGSSALAHPETLAARARRAAQLVVAATWIAIISASLLFAWGCYKGIEKLTEPPSYGALQMSIL
jgi:hypothetical protein